MTWKKSAISYISWLIYTLIVGVVLLCVADVVCDSLGLVVYWAAVISLLYVAVVGGVVFGVRQLYETIVKYCDTKAIMARTIETIVAVLMLAFGVLLRVGNLDLVSDGAGYFEMAKLTYGGELPRVLHGAEDIYLVTLRGLFLLVGNHIEAAIWLQIVLQLLGSWFCFLAVKRLAGPVAGLITLGFATCGFYMVSVSLTLSPEMLYLFLFAMVFWLISLGTGEKLKPISFLPLGFLAAVCTYLDIVGVLLFFLSVCMVFSYREVHANVKIKLVAVLCCVIGFVAAFGGIIGLAAYSAGESFGAVLMMVLGQYAPSGFELPVVLMGGDYAIEGYLLAGLMSFGIYTFWFDKEKEKLSVGTMSMCILIVMICFGMFTPAMPGYTFLYLTMAILAGVSVGGCFIIRTRKATSVETTMEYLENMEAVSGEYLEYENVSEITSDERTEATEEGAGFVVETTEVTEIPVAPKVKLLDNPLPLPKKHEKKVLDFVVELTDSTDEFDFDISESDDFDI